MLRGQLQDQSINSNHAENNAHRSEDLFTVDDDWGVEGDDWSCGIQSDNNKVIAQQADDVSEQCDESANECDITKCDYSLISNSSTATEKTDCDPIAHLQQLNLDDINDDEISSDDAIHVAESAGSQCEAEDVAMTPESDILRRLLKSDDLKDTVCDQNISAGKLSSW